MIAQSVREGLASSDIGRLALNLFPQDPCGRYFMALVAYYDESGTHDSSDVTVLAGFAARPEEWASFEREWAKVLKKWNLPFIHMKHMYHGQKHYRGWKDRDLIRLWADLMYVIQEREIFGTKTVLYEDDYKMFYRLVDGPSKRERLDSRYALCFRSLLYSLPSSYLVQKVESDFSFILEAGHRNAGDALRVFNELKASEHFDHRNIIGKTVSFATKPDFGALQAADMLAYFSFATESDLKDDSERGMFVSDFEAEVLECKLPIIEHLITPEDLLTMRTNFLRKKKLPVFQSIRLDAYNNAIKLNELDGPIFHLGRRWRG